MNTESFENKVAVVTGASEGIGRAVATALAEAGATVHALARNQEKLESLAREYPGGVQVHAVDLGDAAAAAHTYDRINSASERIDILVNNVGGGTFKPLHCQSPAELQVAIDLPFRAAVQACHAFVPGMREQRSGCIVNLTSPAGFVPFPFMAPYVASRHAMVGLSLSLHEELGDLGIQSLLFCPAEVNTGYFQRNDASMDWYPRVSGIFPVLEPEEVAREILRSISRGERQRVYPFSLALFLRIYQLMPRMSIRLLKLMGVWRPKVAPG